MILLTLLLAAAACWAVLLGLALYDRRSAPWLGPHPPLPIGGSAPFVSILLPARNEERNIAACLATLLRQDYPAFEILAIDDSSEDRTRSLILEAARADGRLRLIEGRDPPPGWTGKSHALHLALPWARGEWLLFTDADTRHAPQTVRQTVGYAEREGLDAITLFPLLRCSTFWERLVQPAMVTLIALSHPAFLVNNPGSKRAAGNGQFLLIRRKAYEAVGGHEAVRAHIAEDMALAERLKSSHYRYRAVIGPDLMETRMYTSLGEIWRGWSKNIFEAMGGSALRGLLTALLLLVLSLLPALALATVPLARELGSPAPLSHLIAALGAYLLGTGVALSANTVLRVPARYALLHPLGWTTLAALIAQASWRGKRRRGATWKGRTYYFHNGRGPDGEGLEVPTSWVSP